MLTALVLGGVAALVLAGLAGYNALVRSRNQVTEAWSTVDVQLRRRASLLPNLADAVGAYAQHERESLLEVTRARGLAEPGAGVAASARAGDEVSRALGRLLAVSERYPQLRAAENFRALQDQLADVEDKVAFARQFYNRTVLAYNNRLGVFPTAVIARAFAFERAEFYEADAAAVEEVRLHMQRAPAARPPT